MYRFSYTNLQKIFHVYTGGREMPEQVPDMQKLSATAKNRQDDIQLCHICEKDVAFSLSYIYLCVKFPGMNI